MPPADMGMVDDDTMPIKDQVRLFECPDLHMSPSVSMTHDMQVLEPSIKMGQVSERFLFPSMTSLS